MGCVSPIDRWATGRSRSGYPAAIVSGSQASSPARAASRSAATQYSCTATSISRVCASAGRAEASITRLARPTAMGELASSSSTSACVACLQLRGRDDAVDQADAMGLGGVDQARRS